MRGRYAPGLALLVACGAVNAPQSEATAVAPVAEVAVAPAKPSVKAGDTTTELRAPEQPRRPCRIDIAQWELALVAAHNDRELHGFDPRATDRAFERAGALIDALPQSDPRYVEAHCRFAMGQQHAIAETHYLLANAVLRKQLPKGEARWRFLDLPGTSLATRFSDATPEMQTRIHPEIMGIGHLDDVCRVPDLALLELGQADIYHAAGKRRPGEPPRRERRPKGTKLVRAGSNHTLAVLQEVQAELGADHVYVAALRERLMMECDRNEQQRFPKICRPDDEVRRDVLAVRIRELGDAHRLTRRSKFMVAYDQLDAAGLPEGKRLLQQITEGTHDDVWVLAHQVLAGIELNDGKPEAAFDRLRVVMEEVPRIYAEDQWDHQQAWKIWAEVARAAGKRDVAEHASTQSQAVNDRWRWDGPVGPSLALARIYQDAEELEKRDRVLEHLVHDHDVALATSTSRAEHAWREGDLAIARRCLATK